MIFDELYQALINEPADAPFHYRAHGEGLTDKDIPQFPAVCRLFHENESFHAAVLMQTVKPSSKATQDNQRTWELGDAAEFFIQIPGHEDYYEFHSTPEGIRLQLHLPSYQTFTQFSHESKCCDVGLKVINKIDPERKLWYSELIIPFSGIQAKGPNCKYFFARYNYSDFPEGQKEMSSWPFVVGSFHCPPNWLEYK